MAGNKQHHVWQMLQRGFGEQRGKDHHVWVYRKTEPAKQTVTRLFGVETHFYGPEGSQADTNITKYENDSQSTIQEIRKLPNGAEVDPVFVATLIAHLEIRSAFLRGKTSSTMQKAIGGLVQRFRSPEKLRAVMIAHFKDNPDELDKLLGKGFVAPSQRICFAQFAQKIIEMMPDDELSKLMEQGFGQIVEIVDQFPDLTKAAQNNALVLDVANQSRAKSHLERDYFIFRPASGSLILPDTTLAFVKKEGASPISQKHDDIKAVILPIASDVAIIGRADGKADYSLKTINRLLAGCSFEAFLTKEQSSHFQGLRGRIGKHATLISDLDLQGLIEE